MNPITGVSSASIVTLKESIGLEQFEERLRQVQEGRDVFAKYALKQIHDQICSKELIYALLCLLSWLWKDKETPGGIEGSLPYHKLLDLMPEIHSMSLVQQSDLQQLVYIYYTSISGGIQSNIKKQFENRKKQEQNNGLIQNLITNHTICLNVYFSVWKVSHSPFLKGLAEIGELLLEGDVDSALDIMSTYSSIEATHNGLPTQEPLTENQEPVQIKICKQDDWLLNECPFLISGDEGMCKEIFLSTILEDPQKAGKLLLKTFQILPRDDTAFLAFINEHILFCLSSLIYEYYKRDTRHYKEAVYGLCDQLLLVNIDREINDKIQQIMAYLSVVDCTFLENIEPKGQVPTENGEITQYLILLKQVDVCLSVHIKQVAKQLYANHYHNTCEPTLNNDSVHPMVKRRIIQIKNDLMVATDIFLEGDTEEAKNKFSNIKADLSLISAFIPILYKQLLSSCNAVVKTSAHIFKESDEIEKNQYTREQIEEEISILRRAGFDFGVSLIRQPRSQWKRLILDLVRKDPKRAERLFLNIKTMTLAVSDHSFCYGRIIRELFEQKVRVTKPHANKLCDDFLTELLYRKSIGKESQQAINYLKQWLPEREIEINERLDRIQSLVNQQKDT